MPKDVLMDSIFKPRSISDKNVNNQKQMRVKMMFCHIGIFQTRVQLLV